MKQLDKIAELGRRMAAAFLFLAVVSVVVLVEVTGLAKLENRASLAAEKQADKWGVVLGQAAEADKTVISATSEVVMEDARPEIIRRYLAKYKSPLLPYSDLIFELSQTYGFDYRWIVAIGQQESNLCKKIPEGSHNCWGYGIHKNGTLKFENYELALKSYAEYLDRVYFSKGLNTAETIMKKYCPHSDGSWARGVTQFMDEMENGSF